MAIKEKQKTKSVRLSSEEEKEVKRIIKEVEEEEKQGIIPDFSKGKWIDKRPKKNHN